MQPAEREQQLKFLRDHLRVKQAEDHLLAKKQVEHVFGFLMLELFFSRELNDTQKIEDALDGLGANDSGVDAYFYDEETKTHHLCQFKYSHHKKSSESYAKKGDFALLFRFPESPIAKNNSRRVKAIKSEISEADPSSKIKYHFFHLGSSSDDVLQEYPDVTYYGEEDILKMFMRREDDSEQDEPSGSAKLQISHPQGRDQNAHTIIQFPISGGQKKRGMVCILNGRQLLDIVDQAGHARVFDRNIRAYLGKDFTINKEIIKSALQSPKLFFAYNNGVTITCDRIDTSSPSKTSISIVIEKPRIINGAQTTMSIYEAWRQKKKSSNTEEADSHFEDLLVMCKIIEGTKTENADFAQKITKYCNTQNKVRLADYYSNKKEQDALVKYFLSFGIRYVCKRAADQGLKRRDGHVISIEPLAEYHCAQTYDITKAKASDIFSEGMDYEKDNPIYTDLFLKKKNPDELIDFIVTYHVYRYVSERRKILRAYLSELERTPVSEAIADPERFLSSSEKLNGLLGMTGREMKEALKEKNTHSRHSLIEALSLVSSIDLKWLSLIFRHTISKASLFKDDDGYQSEPIEDYIIRKIRKYKGNPEAQCEAISGVFSEVFYRSAIWYMDFSDKKTIRKSRDNAQKLMEYLGRKIPDLEANPMGRIREP